MIYFILLFNILFSSLSGEEVTLPEPYKGYVPFKSQKKRNYGKEEEQKHLPPYWQNYYYEPYYYYTPPEEEENDYLEPSPT